MRENTLIVALAAVSLFVIAGCDGDIPPPPWVTTCEAISGGGTLRLTWTALTHAKSYEITTDDSTYTTTSLSYDVSTPTGTIEVRGVNGSDKSDPCTIDCKVVETSSLVLYGTSDASGNDPSGLAFTISGSASALSLADANKPSIDFVCEDVDITPVGLANAGDYGWASNTKMNALMDAGTDYDALSEAAGSGAYDSQLSIAANGVYALWLGASTNWSTSDHFAKMKIISVEQPDRVAYQKIGGLRWLVN